MVLFASIFYVWIYHPHHLWSTVNQLWDPQLVIIWLFRTSRSGDCQIEMCDPHHELVSCHLPGGNTTNSVLVLSARAKKHTTTTLFWVLWPVGECLCLSLTHTLPLSPSFTPILEKSSFKALCDDETPWETYCSNHHQPDHGKPFITSGLPCAGQIPFQFQRMENGLSTKLRKICSRFSCFYTKGKKHRRGP